MVKTGLPVAPSPPDSEWGVMARARAIVRAQEKAAMAGAKDSVGSAGGSPVSPGGSFARSAVSALRPVTGSKGPADKPSELGDTATAMEPYIEVPESGAGGVADLAVVLGPLGGAMEPESGIGGAAGLEISTDVPVVVMVPVLGAGGGPGSAASAFSFDTMPKLVATASPGCVASVGGSAQPVAPVLKPMAASLGSFAVTAPAPESGVEGAADMMVCNDVPVASPTVCTLNQAAALLLPAGAIGPKALVALRSAGKAVEQGVVAAAVPEVQVLPPSAGKPSAPDPVLVFGDWLGVDQSGLGLCAPMVEACPVGLKSYSFCSNVLRRRLMT